MANARTIVAVFGVVLGLAATNSAGAQTAPAASQLFETAPTILSVGYVTNTPNMFFGVGGSLLHGDWGIYVDYKWSHDDPRSDQQFIENWTPAQVTSEFPDDQLVRTFDRWRSFNVALVRRLGAYAVYVGAGQANGDQFVEYRSEELDRGYGGYYWLEDGEADTTEANILFGGMFQIMPSLIVQLGYETQPGGVTVGVMLANPFGFF